MFSTRSPLRSFLIVAALMITAPWSLLCADPPAQPITHKLTEFEGLKDKTPLGFRDAAAFAALLKKARSSLAADVLKGTDHEVGFQELYNQPERYRGAFVEVKGLARRVYAPKADNGTNKRLFEIWVTVPGKGPNPFACIVEELPPDFPRKPEIAEPVIFRGFFFKLISYQADKVRRGAPLVIGRLERAGRLVLIEAPAEDRVDRLPLGAVYRRVGPDETERFTVEVDRDGKWTIEGNTIARQNLAKEVSVLAERTRRNARATGFPIDTKLELPAVVVFRAPSETLCSTLSELVDVWQARGFRQFRLRLDHHGPDAARVAKREPVPPVRKESDLPVALRTLPILLFSDGNGSIGRVELGEHVMQGFEALKLELESIFTDQNLPFDQASLEIDPTLRYSEIVHLVDALASLQVTNLAFSSAAKKGGN
jgi:biopolymer transport protein ExbD